jgi:hypothetical protein
MGHADIHRLLIECGFRNQLWPPSLGQHWAVIGELAGGARIVVTCVPSPTGFRLHVAPGAAEWLRRFLLRNDLDMALVSTLPVPLGHPGVDLPWPTWIPLTVGLGAVLIFSWVLLR